MEIKVDEISKIIRQQIEGFETPDRHGRGRHGDLGR